jgi:hypothetical protein
LTHDNSQSGVNNVFKLGTNLIEDYKYDSDLGEISLRRICSESMTFDIVD